MRESFLASMPSCRGARFPRNVSAKIGWLRHHEESVAFLEQWQGRTPNRSFAGREYDLSLLEDLPEEVDPCGERGEFHSFVYAGPMFQDRLGVALGEIVERHNVVFADILAENEVVPGERALRAECPGG